MFFTFDKFPLLGNLDFFCASEPPLLCGTNAELFGIDVGGFGAITCALGTRFSTGTFD